MNSTETRTTETVDSNQNTPKSGFMRHFRMAALGILLGLGVAGCIATTAEALSDADLNNFINKHGLVLKNNKIWAAFGTANNYSDAMETAKEELIKMRHTGYVRDATRVAIVEPPSASETGLWVVILPTVEIGTLPLNNDSDISREPDVEPITQPQQSDLDTKLKLGETRIAEDGVMELDSSQKLRVNTDEAH